MLVEDLLAVSEGHAHGGGALAAGRTEELPQVRLAQGRGPGPRGPRAFRGGPAQGPGAWGQRAQSHSTAGSTREAPWGSAQGTMPRPPRHSEPGGPQTSLCCTWRRQVDRAGWRLPERKGAGGRGGGKREHQWRWEETTWGDEHPMRDGHRKPVSFPSLCRRDECRKR